MSRSSDCLLSIGQVLEGIKMFLFFTVFSICIISNVLASNNSACEKGTLSCDDGKQCVVSEKWCDKIEDCEDKSDEAFCKTKVHWWSYDPNGCSSSGFHFKCSNDMCIPKSVVCNKHDDCKDFSDEIGCDNLEETVPEVSPTTEASKNSEVTSESERERPEDSEVSNKEYNVYDYEDEDLSSKPEIVSQSSLSSDSLSAFSPSTQDYYGNRLKETDPPRQDITSHTATSSTPGYTIPVTTPPPTVTPSNNYLLTTAHNTPRQHRTAGHHYPHLSQTHDRRRQTNERQPYPHYRPYQTYVPQTHDRRSYTTDRHQQAYDRRPSINDRYQQAYDRRSESRDRSSHSYGRHPQAYDRSSHDRRQQPYGPHSQTRGQNYYNQSHPYDSRTSIFSNRLPHPSNYRPSAISNNVLNGEPDWREVASLKPYDGGAEKNQPFHFANNYVDLHGRGTLRQVRRGENWLLNQRNAAGDWGKDTSRALVALSLTNNSFPTGNEDYEFMKRKFIVQLSVSLLGNSSREMPLSRLAGAMNALFAVCENPRDFHSLDLAELLRIRIREAARNRGYPNPFVYLSLCLSGKPLTDSEVQSLMKKMTPSGPQHELSNDMQSVAIQAFACHMHQVSSRDHSYRRILQEKLNSAVSDLLSRMGEDGSFGSVYSTALAAQALISVNDSRGWNAEKTVDFLKQQQQGDGSFGDLLSTYYALPALSGRSLLHLRNTQCTSEPIPRDLTPSEILEFVGPKQFIHYSIYFYYPLVSSDSVRVLVPEGINFLDVMKVAEYQNKNFRFSHETGDKSLNIYSISGTPNDSEQGLSWHLYVKDDSAPNQKELMPNELYSGDVREFFPTANKHMIFWYHPIGLRG